MRAGDNVESSSLIVPSRAIAYVAASINLGNDIGNSRHIFRFQTDEKGHEERVVIAKGFALSILDEGRPIINFGVVDLNERLPSRSVELTSHDVSNFRIQKILSGPSYLDVKIDSSRSAIVVRFLPSAPSGYRGDFVKLQTNSALQPEVWVGIQADIHGDVVPAANPFDFGVMRNGGSSEQRIKLISRSKKTFAIGAIRLENIRGEVTVSRCETPSNDCKLIKLNISNEQPKGSVVGKIWVDLPDERRQLLIAVNGLYLDKDTKIEKLDAEELIRGKKEAESQSVSPNLGLDLGDSIEKAVHAEEDAVPIGSGPLIKWSVTNEAALHGYQLFRADNEKGPYHLLNRETVQVKRQDNAGSKYSFRDNTAESGKTYWYYVGLVYKDGHKQQLTGPQKVVAK
jgi:hypothetical protein